MARRDQGAAAETLEEIESAADRLSEWVQEHFRALIAGVAVLLVGAGVGSAIVSSQRGAEQEASAALEKARGDYLSAMGAGPDALEVPELANPEAAAQIREEYRARFGEVAEEYSGTVAGTLAAIEGARLAGDAGDAEAARTALESALESAPDGPVRGMLLQRLAQRLEGEGQWAEAAAHHAQAAEQGDYPLRGWALADAARCHAEAGDRDTALALYERVKSEMPELQLPPHLRRQYFELRGSAGS